ncbi:hypothetical protein [Heyndrickxia ginsengihumi]|uniref:hypothetical protein n=1 Tax=Heyndrickxia ginsengihumi TaxID=363870 RepID=UPI000AD2357B|nr:hypothetical protein [Heyndrickxia ginsengihumi]
MGDYMGQRIIDGAYTYDFVISKRPDLKDGIDNYLTAQGHTDLIAQTQTTTEQA